MKRGLIAAFVAASITFAIMYILSSSSPYFYLFASVMTAAIGFFAFIFTIMLSELGELRSSRKKQRSTDWDFQNAFSNDVQGFLNQCPGCEQIIVRAVRTSSGDQYGLAVIELKSNMEEDTLYGMLPRMIEDIPDVELVGPFLLSELRRNDIEKRYNRFGYALVGIAIPFLVIGFAASIIIRGFLGMIDWLVPIFIIYFIMTFIPLIGLSLWKRNAEIKSDTEIAQTYPRFIEALQTLVAKHHTLAFGKTSYRSRLERINKQL